MVMHSVSRGSISVQKSKLVSYPPTQLVPHRFLPTLEHQRHNLVRLALDQGPVHTLYKTCQVQSVNEHPYSVNASSAQDNSGRRCT